ncbi:hypothetical protein [Legionella micdadei]|uniref:hypothetical protein n=1 Tax=Legionella micdadei TaxID=451 RepID=UPI0020A4F7F3|nr:hypothetical protein [Legionella micdadei]
MRLSHTIGLSIIVCWLAGCEQVAVISTPKKQAIASNSELAAKAQNYFWETLHGGNYQDIPKADYLLMAAYLQNPNDPKLAAHLGLLHLWKITERQRNKDESPTIVNEIILSRKYLADALQLDQKNPIYQGFAGDTQLIEGQIFHDQREETKAYFLLKKAIHNWPEFNYFTAGYPMTTLPPILKILRKLCLGNGALLICAKEVKLIAKILFIVFPQPKMTRVKNELASILGLRLLALKVFS